MSIEKAVNPLKATATIEGNVASIAFQENAYLESLKANDLSETVVKAVRSHDKGFVVNVTEAAGEEMLEVFKKHKNVTEGITGKVNMLGGNSVQVSFDRSREFNNPKTGETITRHVYSTVKVKDSSASNSELRKVRDEIMEAGLAKLG